jgi:hypothetical protein
MQPTRLTTATVAARIPDANAAPFYALWGEAPFAVRNLVPRELGREAAAGTVDLGLMATGDFLRLDGFELVGPMGVAARGPVQSVLLFSKRPAAALGGALISVTPETSTSIRLLRLLLDVRRGLSGIRYVRGLEPAQAEAMLVIGDRAMRMRNHRPEGFHHLLDLGEDWLEWTGKRRLACGRARSSRSQIAGAGQVPRSRSRRAWRPARWRASKPSRAGACPGTEAAFCGGSTTAWVGDLKAWRASGS